MTDSWTSRFKRAILSLIEKEARCRVLDRRICASIQFVLMLKVLVTPFLAFTAHVAIAQFIDMSNELSLMTNYNSGYLGQGVSSADFTGDHIDDLTFANSQGDIQFFVGNGAGTFEEISIFLEGAAGKDAKMVLWADVENDGDRDLLVTFRSAQNRIYLNSGGGEFTEFSEAAGLRTDDQRSYGASFGDMNNDGFVDLFIANYSSGQNGQNNVNEFYLNQGIDEQNGEWLGFLDQGQQMGLEEIPGTQSFQSQWVDFDLDGQLEVHVVRDRSSLPNYLLEFDGDEFLDFAPQTGLDVMINCMTSSAADYDCDLDEDIFITGFYGENQLLANDGNGVFAPASDASELPLSNVLQAGDASWGANWLDVDNDGWEDLHVAVGTTIFIELALDPEYTMTFDLNPNDAFFWNEGGVFELDTSVVFTDQADYSFATTTGDYNSDGFPDLVSHRAGELAQVLFAVPNENNWVKVELTGTSSNRDGIGAQIVIHSEGHAQSRMVYAGENYLGQNSYIQHFGLGSAEAIDSMLIHWPSGTSSVFYDLGPNTTYLVSELGTYEELGPSSVSGCTYSVACNFSEEAETDDGSCDFSCLFQALCGEGSTWDESIGACICESSTCPGDFDGDGHLSTDDLLTFLVQFGSACDD